MIIDGRNADDTLAACYHSMGYMETYLQGGYAPHYPIPAIPVKAEIAPAGVVIGGIKYPTSGWMYSE